MTPEKAIKFLNDAADYFDKLTLATDEDRSYWAYVTNASGCRQIADLIQELSEHETQIKSGRQGPSEPGM